MDQSTKEVHLLDYLNLLNKRKWVVIACLFITVTTVIIGNHVIIPIYQAESQLVIDKERGKSIVTGQDLEYLDYESYLSEELTFNTQFKMVTSYPVLERVVKNLSLKERYEQEKNLPLEQNFLSTFKTTVRENLKIFKETLQDSLHKFLPPSTEPSQKETDHQPVLSPEQQESSEMMALVSALKGKIKAEQITDTRLVAITVTDEDPVWAQKIANGLVEAYIEYDIAGRLSAAQKFVDWISAQINEMKGKLLESEAAFYRFKNEEKLFSIEEKQGINTQQIGELNAEYLKIRTQRMEIKARLTELDRIMDRRHGRAVGSDLLNDQILINLTKDLTDSQIQLHELKERYKDKHPKVATLNSRIEILHWVFDIRNFWNLPSLNKSQVRG